jgi:Zn-dependent protease
MDERPHFSILGIPVRVRWTFAITVLLGMQSGVVGGIQWAFIVFFSVLLHELGHAFMGRAFGLQPSIQLYAFGGLTSWLGGKNIGHGRSLFISLAGPAVSLSLAVLGFVVALAFPDREVISLFWYVNAFWGLFNLLPIMPMDGGNALRSFLMFVGAPRLAEVGTRVLGITIAAPIAIYAGTRNIFIAMFLGMFAINNVQSLVAYFRQRRDTELLESLRSQYPRWMASKDGKGMIAAALQARAEAKTDYLRAYATEVLAMGQCLDGDARSGLATLESSMPAGMMPGLPIYLHVLFEAGEKERAMTLANEMLAAGDDELKQQAQTVLASRQALSGA